MSEFNYYQHYYQGKWGGQRAGHSIEQTIKYFARKPISDKAKAYHNDLLTFLTLKGVTNGKPFCHPKNKRDLSSQINAMKTLVYKNGLAEEFYKGEWRDDKID